MRSTGDGRARWIGWCLPRCSSGSFSGSSSELEPSIEPASVPGLGGWVGLPDAISTRRKDGVIRCARCGFLSLDAHSPSSGRLYAPLNLSEGARRLPARDLRPQPPTRNSGHRTACSPHPETTGVRHALRRVGVKGGERRKPRLTPVDKSRKVAQTVSHDDLHSAGSNREACRARPQ